MNQLRITFTETEYTALQYALLKREPSLFLKFDRLVADLYGRLTEESSYGRDDLFTLFNSLLVINKEELLDHCRTISKSFRSNEELEPIISSLLCKLWIESMDRRKEEALWSMSFRAYLDSWNVPYKEDMIRIGVPENVEDEDEDDEEEYEKLDESIEKEISEYAKTFADKKMVNTFLYILPDPENEFDQVFEIEDPHSYDIMKGWMAVMGDAYADYYRDNVPYDNSSENISTVELVLHAIKKHNIPLVRYWDSSKTEKINLRWLNEQRK